MSSTAFLFIVKYFNKRFFKRFPLPGQLCVVIFFTLLTYFLRLDSAPQNVPIVGHIPAGLPNPEVPNFYDGFFGELLKEAVPLAVMFFVIHVTISKSVAYQREYAIDANQEFFALGCCNLVGSLFQCFPNATSLSRTSVVNSIGSHTTLHNVPAVLIVILTLTVMTKLLFFLPYSCLAGIVIVGVSGMVDFREAARLFALLGPDVLLWLTAFFVTALLGAMAGIIVSVLLSLLWLLWKSSRPNTAVLGRLPGTAIYRNLKRFPMATETARVKIFRFDASLNFSNSDYFQSKIAALQLHQLGILVLVIDGSSINDLDVTAIRMLNRLVKKFEKDGIVLLFANWKGPMRDFLQRARFYESVSPERCFLSLHDAVIWAEAYVCHAIKCNDSENFEHHLHNRLAEQSEEEECIEGVVTALNSEVPTTVMGELIGAPSSATPRVGSWRHRTATPLSRKIAAEHEMEWQGMTPRSRIATSRADHPSNTPRALPSAKARTRTLLRAVSRASDRDSSVEATTPTTFGLSQCVQSSSMTASYRGGVIRASTPQVPSSGRHEHNHPPTTSPPKRLPMFEWDGLSARIPYVRLVEEVTERGSQRTWGIASAVELENDHVGNLLCTYPADAAAWLGLASNNPLHENGHCL